MRYYVVATPNGGRSHPYILAETVRERDDDGSARDTSIASVVAGDRASILTEKELQATKAGCALLRAWNRHDDRVFDQETEQL